MIRYDATFYSGSSRRCTRRFDGVEEAHFTLLLPRAASNFRVLFPPMTSAGYTTAGGQARVFERAVTAHGEAV